MFNCFYSKKEIYYSLQLGNAVSFHDPLWSELGQFSLETGVRPKKKEIKGVDTNAIKESLAKCIPIRYIT